MGSKKEFGVKIFRIVGYKSIIGPNMRRRKRKIKIGAASVLRYHGTKFRQLNTRGQTRIQTNN